MELSEWLCIIVDWSCPWSNMGNMGIFNNEPLYCSLNYKSYASPGLEVCSRKLEGTACHLKGKKAAVVSVFLPAKRHLSLQTLRTSCAPSKRSAPELHPASVCRSEAAYFEALGIPKSYALGYRV